jgi:tetratricopeptide (TPR) repeat protein
MADDAKLEALRHRVEQDPASIAFAQLAEEYRRAGRFREAVELSIAGLAVHPGYVSARVTLGRALLQLGNLDESQLELENVLRQAPDNLAAVRGLAEIHRKRGDLAESLEQYRAALELARHDPDLEQAVTDLTRQLAPESLAPAMADAPPGPVEGQPVPVEEQPPSNSEIVSTGPSVNSTTDEREPARALRTISALEQWLAACHVARAHRSA